MNVQSIDHCNDFGSEIELGCADDGSRIGIRRRINMGMTDIVY